MKSIAFGQELQARISIQARKLLIVGPKPPPIGGSPLTVQAMLAELSLYPYVQVTLINTSPATDVRKKMEGFNFEKVARSLLILPRYIYEIRGCDAVLVFANDLFAITLAPLLLFLARLFRKPFFLKPVAASLDLFIEAQKKPFREYLLMVLRSTDGILTQTRLLHRDLSNLGCSNVYYLPGCRPLAPIVAVPKDNSAPLRLIFLGHISRLKGTLILLDALRILKEICDQEVICDFFGPIHDEIHDEFVQGIETIPGANYCGMAEPGTGPQLIAHYDALVLPTYHETEGHPGVLIEAMHAGVPAIATQVRTFPELITNGVNGFLVPTQDSRALAEAIKQLAVSPTLRRQMGEANHRKGQEFRADVVVAQLLKIVFPDVLPLKDQR
jgi:glycosyltransferase involved in cell wall biosynthesis